MRVPHGVILAAGRGARMGALTRDVPKPLLAVGGRTLVSRVVDQLSTMADAVHVTVGHHREAVAAHVISLGCASVHATVGHGNGWWLYGTLAGRLPGPVLVSTCDVLAELDVGALLDEHRRQGEPPCMVVPVAPVAGVDGDFIHADGDVVEGLSRDERAPVYCSGLQLLDPVRIRELTEPVEDFADVWRQLIDRRRLRVSRIRPRSWTSIDTPDHLAELDPDCRMPA